MGKGWVCLCGLQHGTTNGLLDACVRVLMVINVTNQDDLIKGGI